MARTARRSAGQVLRGIGVEIAERRRQAVAAVLARRAAQRPQRVLQALGQRHEALAAEHHMGVLEAGTRQPEMIQPVIQRRASIVTPAVAHVGEVRQAHPAGSCDLAEHHLPLRAMHRAPCADAAFQRPANAGAEFGMAAHQFLEYRHRPEARAASSIGTTSASNISASGSGRRRSRGALFSDGSRGSCANGKPVATLIAACAAAAATGWV